MRQRMPYVVSLAETDEWFELDPRSARVEEMMHQIAAAVRLNIAK